MKLLILTTDPTLLKWRTLPKKLDAITQALNKTKNATWEIEVRYRPLVPTLDARYRITHAWYDALSYPLFREGNHFIYLHFSANQWTKYGFPKGLRGSNHADTDFVGESYGWADENTERGDTGLNQFIQNVLHELSHAIARSTGVTDKTHEYHAKHHNISGLFSSYDMAHWHPTYQAGMAKISQLQKIIDALLGTKRPQHFFPLHKTAITQAYGVPNPVWYPRTGHHIGTDYATPIGTAIIAPDDCEVVRAKTDTALGNWCEVRLDDMYLTFAHLKSKPMLGNRKQGWVIGFTGDTGFVTGPHCHVEAWSVPRDVSILTKDNFREYTSDVTRLIK